MQDPLKSSTEPIISVVMSVFNSQDYLNEAIQSILDQTFVNFEFIIIDDGSTDRSPKLIEAFAKQDQRIRVVTRQNKGLIFSLNEGVSLAKGKYIARMDADDISHPKRFQYQVEFLSKNPEIGVVGTHAHLLSNTSTRPWPFYTETHEEIIALLPFHSPFIHPSVMLRKSILPESPFDSAFPHAEDYKLWADLASKTKFHNIEIKLLTYRIHETNISSKHQNIQINNSLKVIKEYLTSNKVHTWNEELHKEIVTSFFQKNQLNPFSLFGYLDELKRSMHNSFFSKKTDWIKAIFAVNNSQIPFSFIFHMLLFHFRSVRHLSITQFLSLTKRSLIK